MHYAGIHVLEVWSLQRYIIPAFYIYLIRYIYPFNGRTDFIGLSSANKIYLSTIRGNSLAEVNEKIDADSKKWESKIIINFIINDEDILRVIDDLYNRIDSLSSIEQIRWGAATENDVTNKYCLEIISYS